MTYGDRLRRWVVVRILPNLRHVDMARFVKASDAEGYLQVVRRLDPEHSYEVMFDGANAGENGAAREEGRLD